MYFILEIIIFIARLFPDRQRETIRHEQSEQEKKPDDSNTTLLGSAKSTPKPRQDQTSAKVTTGSHGSSRSAHISTYSDASLEHDVTDASTLIKAHGSSPRAAQRSASHQQPTRPLRACPSPSHRHATHELQQNSTHACDTHHQPDHRRNGAVGSLSTTNDEQAMVDMVVHEQGANFSKTHPRKTLILKNAEARTQDVTSNTYIYNSASGISSSESTLVNTPTEAFSPLKLQQECGEEAYVSGEQRRSEEVEARSTRPLLRPNNAGNGGPSDAAGKVSQGTGEQVAAEQTGPMVQEGLLRSEEAAHQETRNKLARLEAWCEVLCDENTALQMQLQSADDETKKIRKELEDAEDEDTNLRTQLSAAEDNIRGFEMFFLELRKKLCERESSLRQLGMDFYSRFQDADRLISPHDKVWAEYKDSMTAAAQHFSTSLNAIDENMSSHDNSRFEELGEVGDDDGREMFQNESGAPTFNTDLMMGDSRPTNEVDPIQAEGYGTTSDKDDDHDDDISRHGRPMRPGTASRLSMSFFTAQSEERLGQPSSSHLEDSQEVQAACEPALPATSSSHPYPEAPVDLEEELEYSDGFRFTFGSNYTVSPNIPTAEEADFSRASEVQGMEESIPQPEASQPIFSISFDGAGETSRAGASRRTNNRNDGRGNQNSSRNKSRLPSPSGVTENGDSGPLEAENEPDSQTLGARDAIVDATAAVIDSSLEAQYNLLIQSTNTAAELREARDGKTRMTDSEPDDAPSEKTLRAAWAPFPWVEIEVEVKKSPLDLMNELPFDWMLPTPPTIRLSDVQNRIGESSRSRYSSAVQDGMHIANMKAWIDSIAPLEKGTNAVETLKIQPSRATSKAHDSKDAEGRTLDTMPLSEDQTEEDEGTASGQTQVMEPSSGIQTSQVPQMDLPPFEEELLSLINGIRNLSLGPSIDAVGKVEMESKVQVPRNSNVSGQGDIENLENLINGIRDLSLGSSVDEAGRSIRESKVRLSGDWNVSGLGQYSPKDLDKSPVFGRFIGGKSEVGDPGFTAKGERIAVPEVEITKGADHKCKKARSVVMPSKERNTRQANAERQEEEHETTSPVPTSGEQSNTTNPRTIPHSEHSQTQDVTTNPPTVITSPIETHPQNAIPHQPLAPPPTVPGDDQPPSPSEEVYVSVYSLQGLSHPDAAPKTKYRDPFGLRKERK